MLSQMYSENGRYRDALTAARTATKLQPNADASRQAQDLASDLFTQIFLGPKGDELPPVEALGMFYEFRELTPIGRRGDELIRRLADRLASIDLLDQAAELLQYQVDHRLEGAARAQVAARLAMIYLANRKPDMAITALRASRISDLSGELRQQRLLLEARAQSDVGRHDLALDIVSNVTRARGAAAAVRHLLGGAALARSPPSRSSSITASASATSSRSMRWRRATSSAPPSAMRSPTTRSGCRASARNTRR